MLTACRCAYLIVFSIAFSVAIRSGEADDLASQIPPFVQDRDPALGPTLERLRESSYVAFAEIEDVAKLKKGDFVFNQKAGPAFVAAPIAGTDHILSIETLMRGVIQPQMPLMQIDVPSSRKSHARGRSEMRTAAPSDVESFAQEVRGRELEMRELFLVVAEKNKRLKDIVESVMKKS